MGEEGVEDEAKPTSRGDQASSCSGDSAAGWWYRGSTGAVTVRRDEWEAAEEGERGVESADGERGGREERREEAGRASVPVRSAKVVDSFGRMLLINVLSLRPFLRVDSEEEGSSDVGPGAATGGGGGGTARGSSGGEMKGGGDGSELWRRRRGRNVDAMGRGCFWD